MPRARLAAISGALQRATPWAWIVTLLAGILIAVFAGPKAQPKAQPGAGDDAPVLAAETALSAAMRGGDKSAARRLLGLQFTFIDAGGKAHPRRDFLAALKAVAAAPTGDVKVRRNGLLAAVTGHRKSINDSDVFFLDVWARQKGAWRALVMQDVTLATAPPSVAAAAPSASAPVPDAGAKPGECKNPCQAIPYRVRSPAEQEIVSTYQTIAKATMAHDADEWKKHVADEFMLYGSNRAPISKSARIETIERQKATNAVTTVGEIQTMRLAVYGDGAVMIATDAVPDNSQPPYWATRVWVKRNGQWQMAFSMHTEIK